MNTKPITELTAATFKREVLEATGPVLVDFYAPWCGPCKMLAPVLDRLASELDGRVKFTKANVDELPDEAAFFRITGVPTLILFRDGRMIDQLVGMAPPRELKAWIEQSAGQVAST